MTTAFLAEVDTTAGTRYIMNGGALSRIPFFFYSSKRLKTILENTRDFGQSPYYYVSKRDCEKTRVCVVENVERGLRSSTGLNLSVAEFLKKEFGAKKYAPPQPANAVFKIRLVNSKGKYAGGGKFGRTWERQGDLRLHITNNLERLVNGDYRGANVVMIELDPKDGFTPLKVTQFPILEFYQMSPPCRVRWGSLTQRSLSNVNLDSMKGSEFA